MTTNLTIAVIGIFLIMLGIYVWLRFFDIQEQLEILKETQREKYDLIQNKINKITFQDKVIPHKISEESCRIYNSEGNPICYCDNELTFLDILCQIARNKYEGYFVVKNDLAYKINTDGRIDTKDKPPLFTKYDEYMKELMGF